MMYVFLLFARVRSIKLRELRIDDLGFRNPKLCKRGICLDHERGTFEPSTPVALILVKSQGARIKKVDHETFGERSRSMRCSGPLELNRCVHIYI